MNIQTICVAGAGTMGSGIAQVCAQFGFNAILFDINPDGLLKARALIDKSLQLLVDKQKITAAEKEAVLARIRFETELKNCKAELVIEAIVEKTDAKVYIFNELAMINSPQTILASNTSSLSITDIQSHVSHPERVVGMHFFNPAPVMKLVEVVMGKQTSDATAGLIMDLCNRLGKTAVVCKDAPGFIVNRVARHYYLEAMNLAEKNFAALEDIDTIMEATGFKMGPFKLMDLIGMDINLAVSQSVYEAFKKEERFKPAALQIQKVAAGELGKKTGKGFYTYS